jgi:DNA-binding transcriptional MerR regulator
MNTQELAKTLDIAPEKLSAWIKELGITFNSDESGQTVVPEAWIAYFKQVKALFSAGKKASDIRKAVPMPEPPPAADAPNAEAGANSRQVLQETFRQMEMRIVSMQFHLKNTQSEMVKEQKNLAKVQKQVEDLTRTVDVLQKNLSGSQKTNETVNQFLNRYWLYQALTVAITVLLVLILGRLFTPPVPKVTPPPPVASASPNAETGGSEDYGSSDSTNASPSPSASSLP